MAYSNPRGIIAASVILEIIAVTAVALRFISIRRRQSRCTTSDWLILAAVVCSTGLTVMEIYGVAVKALAEPLNATIEDPRAVDGRLNKTKHIELSFLLLGIFTLGLIKMSIAFLYWKIFITRTFPRFIAVWIMVLALWTLSFVLTGLLECGSHLLALFGTPQSYLKSCGSAIGAGWANVGSDVATDVITLILPIPMIWSLQMQTKKKFLTAAVFLVGLLSIGASVAKAYIYIRASLGLYNEDAILTLTAISVWNLVEVQVGIIAACAPTLRTILGEILPTASLISLTHNIRGRISSSQRSTGTDSHAKSGSDDELCQRELGDYVYKAENARNETELPVIEKPGMIHVQSGVTVEHV